MEQFTDFLDVIIWPFTTLILVYLLRKPIMSLLPYVENLKYKDLEVTFRKELEQAKEEYGAEHLPAPLETDSKSTAYQLVEVSPASAIIEAWKSLEIAAVEKIQELVAEKEKQQRYQRNPFNYLEYSGALTPNEANAIRDMRRLRNQAAHTDEIKISKGDAIEYISLATSISNKIKVITELPKVNLTALTLLVLQLNALIDSGEFNDISIDKIYSVIESKSILPFLRERTKGKADFSLLGPDGPYPNFEDFYHDQMEKMYYGYAGDHRRKWGVKNIGLCLLLAWTNELIQQGAGWHPNEL
ncbi:MAG: hypothetical protein SVT56_10165 [Chloroflexota bacterium]|nr:hypothetical protein [Chloroflexota bacterium]